MQITQALHTAILVSQLEQAEYFYGTLLGLQKVDRVLKFPGAWYQIGSYQIHLIVDPNPTIPLINPEKLGRNQHIAFQVASLAEAKTQLLAAGCNIQMSASGRPALFTQDPDGNIIELGE